MALCFFSSSGMVMVVRNVSCFVFRGVVLVGLVAFPPIDLAISTIWLASVWFCRCMFCFLFVIRGWFCISVKPLMKICLSRILLISMEVGSVLVVGLLMVLYLFSFCR